MPKRSRGFWVCDYCDFTFDRFDEASAHENQECRQRVARGRPSFVSNPLSLEQQAPYTFNTMAPLSRQEERTAHATTYAGYGYEGMGEVWTRPLLGPQQSTYLTEADMLTCRSLELFELRESDFGRTSRDESGIRQLGLRCSYCRGGGEQSGQTRGYIIPSSVASVGDDVRTISEEHLMSCYAAPMDLRSILRLALQKRSQKKAEGGLSWHEEENNRRCLLDFCISQCRQLQIVDKLPERSGIVLSQSVGAQDSSVRAATMRAGSTSQYLHGVAKATPQQNRWDTQATQGPLIRSDQAMQTTPVALRSTLGNMASAFGAPVHSPDVSVAGRPTSHIEPVPLESTDSMSVSEQLSPQPAFGLGNFPFFQCPNGDWMCKFCSHLPPDYRAQHFLWSTPSKSPPASNFINHHLSLCREFNRSQYSFFQGAQTTYPYADFSSPAGYVPQQHQWEVTQDFPGQPGRGRFAPKDYSPRELSDVSFEHREALVPTQPQGFSHQLETLAPVARSEAEMDIASRRAIEHLAATDLSIYDNNGKPVPEDNKLVLDEDRLLLTDYFFYLMKQLRLVRFSESDRRTRGGKREKIQVGYGGLQCVHCSDAPNARKFFWSNVDRLANSFAEIPGHILKCRRCPQITKDALLQLKQLHPEQMARLPRGSQKVFFRRMWRRLHLHDPVDQPEALAAAPGPTEASQLRPPKPPPLDTKPSVARESPDQTTGSDESILLLERSATEAAKALADASMQAGPPSPSSRVLLAIPEDKEWLSDTDCFVRRQIEVFCATKDDVHAAQVDRKYGVKEGQVGIRCIHCAMAGGARLNAVAYPFAISGVYESVREFQRLHLEECKSLPPAVKSKLDGLKGCSSLSSVLRKYYVLSAQALGLHDTKDGVRAGANPVPIGSQATFAFSEESSTVSEEMKGIVATASPVVGELSSSVMGERDTGASKKRKHTEEPSEGPELKKSPPGSSS